MALVVVTGGAGFVGSHVVDALAEAGQDVRVIDILLPEAHSGRPGYLNPAAEFVRCDVRDEAALTAALSDASAVCHQAAMVGLGVDMADVTRYVSHNCAGTAALLRVLACQGFRGRLLLASSMVVYGEGRYECASHGAVQAPPRSAIELAAGRFEPACPACGGALSAVEVPEETPPDPRNVYAATKLHQEHLMGIYARECGVSLSVLRYHNVYGPRMPRDTPYAGVASIFRSALESGSAPRVFEDGAQLRDFVHVRDVATANVAALREDAPAGVFNVASGRPRSVGELAGALSAELDGPAPVITGDWRLGDVRHVFAGTARAREQLGFAARISFEDGVAEFARAELRDPAARPVLA